MIKGRVNDALARFVEVSPHFGPPEDDHEKQLKHLRKSLNTINKLASRYLTICVILLLILFAGSCALVIYSFHNPGQITAIFGATGLSFMGIIRQMLRLWKEKVDSDLFLTLAANAEPAELRKMLQAMLEARMKVNA